MQFNLSVLPAFITAANGIRLGLSILELLFIIFLFILSRQISSLQTIVMTRLFGSLVQIAGYILLFFGIVLFFITVMIR